ncbi:MAG TPA: hypothetical protein VIR30_13450 [Nocardioides sp.]
MRPVISVQRGAVPWQPANDAELVATFNKFNVPTIGVVRQDGVEYLFRCVSGHGSVVTAWTYGRLDHDRRAAIEAAEGREAIDAALRSAARFPAVLAIVAEGFGIVASETITASSATSEATERLFRAFDEWRDGWRVPEGTRQDVELALAST